jgi:hypothetical protein
MDNKNDIFEKTLSVMKEVEKYNDKKGIDKKEIVIMLVHKYFNDKYKNDDSFNLMLNYAIEFTIIFSKNKSIINGINTSKFYFVNKIIFI